jgi:hypothetical protein
LLVKNYRCSSRIIVGASKAAVVGTGAADPSSLYDGGASSGSRHVPSQVLATLSTAKDKRFKPFWLRHGYLHVFLPGRESSAGISYRY